jgi:hypothetical protein
MTAPTADRVIVALAMQYQASMIAADKLVAEFYPSMIW